MSAAVQHVRVVVVSPGDVGDERAATQAVVEELNGAIAAERGCRLSVWRWETDAGAGLHLDGPQGLIDDDMKIEDSDVVVGIFWKRFGTPTHGAGSGTEHELRRAWSSWEQTGSPQVFVYFCTRPYAPSSRSEAEQWGRVLEFQEELPDRQMRWRYESVADFEKLLRRHLTRFVLDRPPVASPPVGRSPRVRFNLPPVAASFTGREDELEAIDAALGVADRAVITQAIAGLGGVGKSQLAARYVQTRADDFDIVAWIRAEDGGTGDLAALAAKLGTSAAGLAPGERAKLAREALGASDARWLLVLDNIESAQQLAGLLPGSGNGRVLVTSRDRALGEFGPVLAVDVFDEDTATEYLVTRAGRPDDEQAARTLARALGCLPLALSHAAAYCRSGTSFADYLELLDELPARELFGTHSEQSYAKTVASTWKTSIAAASREAPLAADVLEMAAYLAPDAIPKSLFGVLVDRASATGRHRLTLAFNALARLSLATVHDDALDMHRLLQRIIREIVVDDRPAQSALDAVEDAFPKDYELPDRWLECERLLPHALALGDTFRQPGDVGARLVRLLNDASGYARSADPGPRGLAVAEHNLARAERLLGTEHAESANARESLAMACWAAGRTADAIAIYQPLLADRERIAGPQHPNTLNTRNNLAIAYRNAGRTAEALAIYEPLLADRERILGPKHPDTLSTRNNLAHAYVAAGRVTEAIAIYEPLLADSARILGDEHPETFRIRNNVAIAYRRAGRPARAISIHERLLADRERVLGAEHPETLTTRNNLAIALNAAGRTTEAIAIITPLLANFERILGPEHPNTLRTRSNLASAYLASGRTLDAIAIYESLLTDRERVLGPAHPDTVGTRGELADAYDEAGRAIEAERLRQPPDGAS